MSESVSQTAVAALPRDEQPFRVESEFQPAAIQALAEIGDPRVLPLLRAAKAAGLKLAIASTTTSANVDALLAANLGAARDLAFDAIACGDQVPVKKPAPDIYRLTLSSLRIPAENCIAFEDSLNGLRAAKAAGLATVVTPSRWTMEEDFSGADLVLPSLEGLELARLERLLGEAHASA